MPGGRRQRSRLRGADTDGASCGALRGSAAVPLRLKPTCSPRGRDSRRDSPGGSLSTSTSVVDTPGHDSRSAVTAWSTGAYPTRASPPSAAARARHRPREGFPDGRGSSVVAAQWSQPSWSQTTEMVRVRRASPRSMLTRCSRSDPPVGPVVRLETQQSFGWRLRSMSNTIQSNPTLSNRRRGNIIQQGAVER